MTTAHGTHLEVLAPVPPHRRRGGFTLLELLVVLMVMTALLMMGVAVVFVLGPRLNRSAVAQLARLGTLTDTAEQFRADTASALEAADQLGPYRAGGDTLILRVAEESGTSPTHLIWHWDGTDLWRIRWGDDTPKYGRLGADDTFGTVSFHVENRQGTMQVIMQLEARRDPRYRKLRAAPARVDVVGVLGADRR